MPDVIKNTETTHDNIGRGDVKASGPGRNTFPFPLNSVMLIGVISEGPVFSHHVHDLSFYSAKVSVTRHSGVIDTIPLVIPENILKNCPDCEGKTVYIRGNYRSRNVYSRDREKKHLILYVHVRYIDYPNNPNIQRTNNTLLTATVVKPPVLRRTPLSNRLICDVLVAVSRGGRGRFSDYIPVIFWSRQASLIGKCKTGDKLQISGQIQSREYMKRYDEERKENKIAYEVSAYKLKILSPDR